MPASPLVAVVAYHLRPRRVEGWRAGAFAVPEPYVDAVRRAGGAPTLLPPGEAQTPRDLLARFDALLLVGGGDVEPWRFGQEPHERLSGLEPDRDALEIDLLLEADRRGLPALCVCRGMQVLNVAFGGTLYQHLPDHDRYRSHGTPGTTDAVLHDVALVEGSRIALASGTEVLSCSSHHHQGVDRVGEGLVAAGHSPDGLVEAIEREDEVEGWLVGVQWHPEDTAGSDPSQQRLFDALVERAR